MHVLNVYKLLKYVVCIQLTLPYLKINAIPRIEDLNYPIERIAFGSCNDQNLEQTLWDPIMEFKNELFIWMGDVIYADVQEAKDFSKNPFKFLKPAVPETIERSLQMQLENPSYSQVASKIPIIGVWDDHDYGTNDGNNKYPHREISQKYFLDFLNEPKDSIRRKQEGVYASYVIGSGEKTIKIFLLDNRYHKDPYDVKDGEMLGKAQWEWFEHEIQSSTAAFNIIVSGIQMLPTDRFFPAECWHRFPSQRKKLLDLILQSTAKGVVLLSGDVHTGELNEVTCGEEQTIKEITSSGMTHSWLEFHVRQMSFFTGTIFNLAQKILPWEFRPEHAAVYGNINYGQIEIDWAAEKHPVATISVRGHNGQVQLETKVASLPTKVSALTADDCTPPRPVKQITRTTRKWVLIGAIAAFFWSLITLIFLCFILIKRLFIGLKKQTKEKSN